MLTASGTATVLGGVFLQFVIGGMFHWRTVAAVSAIIPFLACNAVFLVPETPYWLFARDRVEEAHKSLQWLRGWVTFDHVEDEFKGIVNAVEDLKAEQKAKKMEQQNLGAKLKPFKKRSFIAPFSLVISGFMFGHFSGMTPLQTYAIDILSSYKVPIDEYYATIYLGLAQFVGCIFGMVLVRIVGKRRIVFISFIGCALCFFAAATQAHYLYGSTQRDFDSQENSLNSSIQNLAKNTLDAEFVLQMNNFTDIEIANNQNGAEELTKDSQNLDALLQKYNLHHVNSNTSQIFKQADQLGIDVGMLYEILSINRIIIPNMPNKENRTAASKLVNKIERISFDILQFNRTGKTFQLQKRIDDLSTILSTFTWNNLSASKDEDVLSSIWRWMPLIILLAGSMFAHLGAKLFPWMLIGEVCILYMLTCIQIIKFNCLSTGVYNGHSQCSSRNIKRNQLFHWVFIK